MRLVPRWEFDIYALALPRGHGFGDNPPIGAWGSDDGKNMGIVTRHVESKNIGTIVMRRRADAVWEVIKREAGFASVDAAKKALEPDLAENLPPAPMPPGTRPLRSLFDFGDREPNEMFRYLVNKAHQPAAWALTQIYMSFPKPDRNWVSDCQSNHFHTRLWEAQLLASLREQGLLVEQPVESPDFRIQNKRGGEAWIEAVTANPPADYNHMNAPIADMPTEKEEVFFGPAALRFAKTIGNKLERNYDQMDHVKGKPFVLAIADFHAGGSMIWSREGLTGYLLGAGATVAEVNGKPQAVPLPAEFLLGPAKFPAGLFRDDKHAGLAAVVFTNACSISKLSRVPISAAATAPEGYRFTRMGVFFDRTPGALKPRPFCLDITSEEYRALWPQGFEPWTAELEVFHNPFARHPLPFDLLPEATHWFEVKGEWMCQSFYETSILWSRTRIDNADQPPFTMADIERGMAELLEKEGAQKPASPA
ncbi:hypothetical protein [Aestuariivirga litoralis]|uniref:hypothetical protein n=1 Tax=Aestuariivirga litoralis TaxID=2650924 RepID=UPI0018C61CD0|nr:hypothetical protein [Aestuariivirga litoralis]MBG1233962.1 hypothetical protein [Aestuariivirga litoralis]